MNNSIAIKEALSAGWELTKKRYPLILSFLGTFVALGVVRFALDKAIDAVAIKVILGLGFQVLNWFVTFNALGVSIKLIDGQEVSYGDLWRPQGPFWFYVLATLLYGLITAAGVLLLIVPGIIWGLMFMFYGYAMIEKKCGPIQALKASKALTSGAKGGLFLFTLTSIGINLLGALLIGLGLFVTLPMTYFAIAHIYRQRSRVLSESTAV